MWFFFSFLVLVSVFGRLETFVERPTMENWRSFALDLKIIVLAVIKRSVTFNATLGSVDYRQLLQVVVKNNVW